jgi:hypothetical protein
MRSSIALLIGCVIGIAATAAPTLDDINLIKARFAQEKLGSASVEFASDGRIRLTGQYRDRAEVQLAFTLAQQLAGVRWIAPTTPENVRYPGTESMAQDIKAKLRATRPRSTTAAPTEGDRHALVVGVGKYVDQIPPIVNAGDDAKAFFNFLGTKNFTREHMQLLLEDQATKQNVALAMLDLQNRVKPNDTIVLFFSTHGSPPNDLGNVSVILHDTRVDQKRKWLDPKTTLQDDDIKQFIERVSPARVMVVLDVCYSGAAFSKIPGFLASTSKDLFVEESNFATGVDQRSLSYLAGQRQEQEKILIAASGPGEKSWNSASLKHGYFTYYFVEELKGKGDVQRAFLSAKPIVQEQVKRVVSAERKTEVSQTPQATFIPEAANLKF